LLEYTTGVRDPQAAALELLDLVVERIAMPRRIADGVRRIMAVLPKLAQGRLGRLARTELAAPALDALELELLARGRPTDMVHTMRAELGPVEPAPEPRHRPRPHAGTRPSRRHG
jgi:poly(A) polymerase